MGLIQVVKNLFTSQPFDSPQPVETSKEEKWSRVNTVFVAGGDGAVWSPKRYDSFALEAFLTNVIGFRCIHAIASAMESVDWRVEQKNSDGTFEEITDHPVLDVMEYPNPEEDWGGLVYRHTAFWIISGNAYMERIMVNERDKGGYPRELWSHRPDRIHILDNPNTGLRRGYVYQGPSGRKVTWPVDEISGRANIWHLKSFHPLNDWYGAGPVEPTAHAIDIGNQIDEWNQNLLQNGARPAMILSFKQALGDIEYNRLETKLREKRQGPKNAGKTLILEGDGATATPYGYSPEEMDYISSNQEAARRIAIGFGVPPMLLGIPGDNTYSNYQEARCAFWEDTMFYYMRRFGRGFSHWMFDPREHIRIHPNLDTIPALEPRRKEQYEKAEGADFLTINEKRIMTGHEKYEHVLDEAASDDDGDNDPADKIYQQASMVELGEKPEDMNGEGDLGNPDDPTDTGEPDLPGDNVPADEEDDSESDKE